MSKPATTGSGAVGAPALVCPAGTLTNLTVRVKYSNGGKPVDKATVTARGPSSKTGVTPPEGSVAFRGITPSPPVYRVNARKDGISTDTKEVSVPCGSSSTVDLTLPGLVKPSIAPAKAVIAVRKHYAEASWKTSRVKYVLKTDFAFDGTGTLERSSDAIRFFDKNTGGTEIKFDRNRREFPGDKLSSAAGGVVLWAQGARPSAKLDDIKLTLTLKSKTMVVDPPAKTTATCVEATLDICQTRTKSGAVPAPMPQPPEKHPAPGAAATDKYFGGRFVHEQDPPANSHGRAMVIVRKIEAPADYAGELVVTPLDARVQIFAAETGGSALASFKVKNADIPKGGSTIWMEGKGVSGALRDTGLSLAITGLSDDMDRVRATVVRFSRIQATIHPTPSMTPANSTAFGAAAPADHVFRSTSFSEDFTKNRPLVLMRNAQPDIALEVALAPAGVPIKWQAIRNSSDHGSLGKPEETPAVRRTAALTANLNPNRRGSFHVRAFVDCNNTDRFEDNEPSIPLNLVVADVTVVRDNSSAHGNTAALPALLQATINGGVGITNGSWTAGAAGAAMEMELIADVTGGGADGLLGLDRVFAGLINVIDRLEWKGTYRDTTAAPPTTVGLSFIAPSNRPAAARQGAFGGNDIFAAADAAPVLYAFPLLDTGRSPGTGTGGETATMSRSRRVTPPAARPVGQRWTIRCIDSPSTGFPRNHPLNASAVLTHVHQRVSFRACFCFWTNTATPPSAGATGDPADRVYSVVRIVPWEIVGDWNVNYAAAPPRLTATTAHAVRAPRASRKTLDPIARAQDHNVEVRPPSPILVFAWDGR